jgi:transcriptional regulator with XRE-family HTH domain
MPMSLGRRFGAHVRALREARHLTQEALAELSDLSVDAIRRIERGAFSPSLNTLAGLAGGLEVSLATLFEGFDRGRRDDVAEVADYLATRTAREVRTVWRIVRALFEEG